MSVEVWPLSEGARAGRRDVFQVTRPTNASQKPETKENRHVPQDVALFAGGPRIARCGRRPDPGLWLPRPSDPPTRPPLGPPCPCLAAPRVLLDGRGQRLGPRSPRLRGPLRVARP